MDIEILLGEDGLAAVAKAEAAAEAQAAADAELGYSGSNSAGGEPGAAHTEGVHAEADKKDARAAATGAAATAAGEAKTAGGRAQDRDSAGTVPPGDGKTSRPRWLALEVEVHACGDIDVPYLMAVIKVCFEQVGASVGIEDAESMSYSGRKYCPPLESETKATKLTFPAKVLLGTTVRVRDIVLLFLARFGYKE